MSKLAVHRYGDFKVVYRCKDEAAYPANISGYTYALKIYAVAGDASPVVTINSTSSVGDLQLGVVRFELLDTVLAPVAASAYYTVTGVLGSENYILDSGEFIRYT